MSKLSSNVKITNNKNQKKAATLKLVQVQFNYITPSNQAKLTNLNEQ